MLVKVGTKTVASGRNRTRCATLQGSIHHRQSEEDTAGQGMLRPPLHRSGGVEMHGQFLDLITPGAPLQLPSV